MLLSHPIASVRNAKTQTCNITLATPADEPGGYVKVSFSARTKFEDRQALAIERIYGLKAYLAAGIGQSLMNKSIAVAQEAGLEYVWLGVWEHYPRVIQLIRRDDT